MYAPKQFREARPDVLLSAIRSIRFATLVMTSPDGPEAVHLPMMAAEVEGSIVIEGHIALANPIWKLITAGTKALVIFQGPQAYVHPGWLATKRETGKAVPTWNYVSIHAHGRVSVMREAAWLRRHVEDLTALNEAGQAEPWSVSDAPEGYIQMLLAAIVGLRLDVSRLEGVWKMIQHHPQANRLGVIAGLSQSKAFNDQAMAATMQYAEEDRVGGS